MTVAAALTAAALMTAGVAYAADGPAPIPDWIKEVAEFWAAGKIDDKVYAGTIEYLVKAGIITIQTEQAPAEVAPVCEQFKANNIDHFTKLGLYVSGQQYAEHSESLEYLASIHGMLDEREGQYLASTTKEERDSCLADAVPEGLVWAEFTSMAWQYVNVVDGDVGSGSDFDFKAHYTVQNNLTGYYELLEAEPPPTRQDVSSFEAAGTDSTRTIYSRSVEQDTSLFEAAVTGCFQVNGYVTVSSTIENTGSQTSTVKYKVYVTAEDGTVAHSKTFGTGNLHPGTTANTRDNIPGISDDWSECGIEVESATAMIDSEVPDDPSPPDTSTENSILDVGFVNCHQSSSAYVNVEGSIKNMGTRTYDVDYIIYLADANEDIITLDTKKIWDLRPGQTEFVDGLIRYSGSWAYCGIQTTSVE